MGTWPAGVCCAGVLTEDLKCCEDDVDRCGVCGGADAGCRYVASLTFRASAPLSSLERLTACAVLQNSLANVIVANEQVDCVLTERAVVSAPSSRKLSQSDASASDVALNVKMSMGAATPEALVMLQLVSPGAPPCDLHAVLLLSLCATQEREISV
jgi:hypothetical protein